MTLHLNRVPENCILRTDNPTARVTSRGKGFPNRGFRHAIANTNIVRAIELSYYQTPEEAWQDTPKHKEVYLGDELHVEVNVDIFGNVGTNTLPAYAIRQGNSIKSLLPRGAWPRHYAADPCHLTEEDISELVLDAIRHRKVPFSWSVVRPRYGDLIGDILIFWPSHAPFYGAAAMDKLGECLDLAQFTRRHPFSPEIIHVGMPWLSKQEFDGEYAILCGVGKKRMVVVNGGWYDGGVKKPITFQRGDSTLPIRSAAIIYHLAMTRLRNGKVVGIGATTAAGKSEGSSDEMDLLTPGKLIWVPQGSVEGSRGRGKQAVVDISRRSPMITEESEVLVNRRIGSDDITALMVTPTGKPAGVEDEVKDIFYRADLCTGPGTLPIAERCVEGKVEGRIKYSGIGFNKRTKKFVPWKHVMLGTKRKNTNPRISYPTQSNPDYEKSSETEPIEIDYLMLSIPVPFIPNGWHMPTILRVDTNDFLAHSLHGARANKGNPALGAVGDGRWAFEGYGGKKAFSLDTQASMFRRDWSRFWCALHRKTPCFVVFNGYSAGMRQKFKYSGTFLWRCLIENHSTAFLRAPLLPVPGVFNGGVPNLDKFLAEEQLPDRRLWDPRVLDQESLIRDGRLLDRFCYEAMNRIHGQDGLGQDSRQVLEGLMRRYARESKKRREFA